MMSAAELGREWTSRVGNDLATARQRLGWALPDVASGLRIRLSYLEALEEGRFADLPGSAYALGFLRTYSTALGLDPEEMARRFRAEAASAARKPELTFPAPVPDRGVPAGAVVLLGVLVAIGGYVGWYHMSGDSRHRTEAVTAVPDRLATLADVPPPAPTPTPAPAPAVVASVTTPLPGGLPATPPAPGSVTADAGAANPAFAQVVPMPAGSSSPTSAQAATLSGTPGFGQPQANGLALPPAADGGRIVLRAHADSWVQVRDHGGQVLLNRVLRNGESWAVPNKPGLSLTTGNAGGTDVLVDGAVAPGFGGNGVVRRDIPLDADTIKAGRLPIQMASNGAPGGAAPTAVTGSATFPNSTPKPSAQ